MIRGDDLFIYIVIFCLVGILGIMTLGIYQIIKLLDKLCILIKLFNNNVVEIAERKQER